MTRAIKSEVVHLQMRDFDVPGSGYRVHLCTLRFCTAGLYSEG